MTVGTTGATAFCPVDEWTFSPRYTEGVCPLCGWRPEGMLVAPPLSRRIDWFYPGLAALVVTSVVMLILVVLAYNR
jgi:hypothetical protein